MVSLEGFAVICRECGSECEIGVNDVFDGDAELIAICENCSILEICQTEVGAINE